MNLDVKMDGLEEVVKAVEQAQEKQRELTAAIAAVRVAVDNLQLEINQASDSADG